MIRETQRIYRSDEIGRGDRRQFFKTGIFNF